MIDPLAIDWMGQLATITSTVIGGAILWGLRMTYSKVDRIEDMAEENREKVNEIEDRICQ